MKAGKKKVFNVIYGRILMIIVILLEPVNNFVYSKFPLGNNE